MSAPPDFGTDHLVVHSDLLAGLVASESAGTMTEGHSAAIDAGILEVLSAIEAEVGRPYAFIEQYDGRLVQDIRPVPGRERELSSRGRAPLVLHTDDAFLDRRARPEAVALVGIEHHDAVPTLIVRLDDVIDSLTPNTVQVLMSSSFVHASPPTFDLPCEVGAEVTCRPILRQRPDGVFEAALSASGPATKVDRRLDRHVAVFRRAAREAPSAQLRFAPGCVHVISNTRLLHGRPGVVTNRWLKRVYLRRDLSDLDALAPTGSPSVYSAARMVTHGLVDPAPW